MANEKQTIIIQLNKIDSNKNNSNKYEFNQ